MGCSRFSTKCATKVDPADPSSTWTFLQPLDLPSNQNRWRLPPLPLKTKQTNKNEQSEISLSPSASESHPTPHTYTVTDQSVIKFCRLPLHHLLVPTWTVVPTLGHSSSPPPTDSPTLPSKPFSVCIQAELLKHKSIKWKTNPWVSTAYWHPEPSSPS